MNESYTKILDSCVGFSEIAQSEKIKKYISWAKSAIEEDHVLTVAVAETGVDVSTFFNLVSTLFGEELLKEIGTKLPRTPMCITLENGKEFGFFRVTTEGTEAISMETIEESQEVLELIITLPNEKLINSRIMLMIGVDSTEIWKLAIDEADIICLRTNATMAMTLNEKKWIEEIIAKRFGVNNFGIWVDKINVLNNDDELNGVIESISTVVSKLEISANCFYSIPETLDYIKSASADKSLASQRIKRIIRNLLNDCNDEICLLLDSKFSDTNETEKAISDLESTKKRMEIAGQIASRTTFSNAMNELCIQVKESARNYNTQICNNILEKINSANDKELETLVDQIEPYITRVWNYYSTELSNRTKKDIEAIFDRVVVRMEEDAGVLYALLDDNTIKIIQDSFDFADNDIWALRVITSGNSDIDDANPIERLKKRTRTTMLLSIPLVVVNPYLAVASFAGSGFAGVLGKKNAMKEYRSQVISQIDSICSGVLTDILEKIETGFDDAVNQGSDNIMKAYNGIVDILVHQIKEMQTKQIEINERRASLKRIIKDTIPELLQTI